MHCCVRGLVFNPFVYSVAVKVYVVFLCGCLITLSVEHDSF